MAEPITYKEFYNKDRGLPEPIWGIKIHLTKCPNCSSTDMYLSAHPDDPEEIIVYDNVRCAHCGWITDWYEAHEQLIHHRADLEREVIGKPA